MFHQYFNLELSQSNCEMAPCSSGSDPNWRAVWNLKIPLKAKIFLWRALCDILPHGANLHHKGITGVGLCTHCGCVEEDMYVLKKFQMVW